MRTLSCMSSHSCSTENSRLRKGPECTPHRTLYTDIIRGVASAVLALDCDSPLLVIPIHIIKIPFDLTRIRFFCRNRELAYFCYASFSSV